MEGCGGNVGSGANGERVRKGMGIGRSGLGECI